MEQFTASEVRKLIERLTDHNHLPAVARACLALRAFADLLEAREKAVPVGYVHKGYLDRDCFNEELYVTRNRVRDDQLPLYTHSAPSDAERLAEALREFDGAFHKELADLTRIPEDDRGRIDRPSAMDCVVGLRRCWDKLSATRARSAQAQPPAARVPDAETLRLHLGELTPDEVCVAKAAYRLALAAQENHNG